MFRIHSPPRSEGFHPKRMAFFSNPIILDIDFSPALARIGHGLDYRIVGRISRHPQTSFLLKVEMNAIGKSEGYANFRSILESPIPKVPLATIPKRRDLCPRPSPRRTLPLLMHLAVAKIPTRGTLACLDRRKAIINGYPQLRLA